MNYCIVYDNYNRLRIRCGDNAFTQRQSYGLAEEMNAPCFIEKAEANFRSGSILVTYENGCKQLVLDYIKGVNRKSYLKLMHSKL